MSLGEMDDVGSGLADVVQVSVDGAHPDPALPVLAESRDQVVGERGVVRVVVPEHEVADLPAQAVSGGRQPQDALAVEEHGPDGRRRNRGGLALDMGKVDDLERFPLDDGQSFRFQADPDLPVPDSEAPHPFSGEQGVSILVGVGTVGVERLLARMVDADSPQRSHHDLALRREAQPGDLVIRKRVAVRFGMKEAVRLPRGDIHPVQPLQRADPDFVAGTQIRGRLVVFSDVDPRQDSGQGQPFPFDVPDFEEMSPEGDPGGTVSFDILDPGHEPGVRDLAMQGIDLASVARFGKGDSVQDVVRNEPQASVGVPVHVSRRMRPPPRPGHPGE